MSLVPGKCTKCGSVLTLDPDKDAEICPFCGAPFVVRDAIALYKNEKNTDTAAASVHAAPALERQIGHLPGFESNEITLIRYTGHDKNVVIPEGYREIDEKCFLHSDIESVTLPRSLKVIGDGAFMGCEKLRSVNCENVREVGRMAFFGCRFLEKMDCPHAQKIGAAAFAGCDSLTSLCVSPDAVKEGEGWCFYEDRRDISVLYECKSLSSIAIGDRMLSYTAPLKEQRLINHLFNGTLLKVQMDRYINHLCIYCGGTLKGMIHKKCSRCGRPWK